jgi:hypothetical protein
MKRLLSVCAIALPLVALSAAPAQADVKTRDKGQVKFEGMLGRMFNLFGGKAAKEGVVSATAVKGNRKATMNEDSGRIVDLSEEKIYEIDMKKKSYTVKTFDEIRREMREAREKAEKEAQKETGRPEQAEKPQKELEVDFDVKETGQKKTVAGYDTREVVMTITVREKGQTLENGGGVVLTADSWFGPEIPQMKEAAEFEMRYWKQLEGPEAAAMSAQQMAAVIAMFPMVKQAMERMQKEGPKLQGTPLATTTMVEAVKSKDQMIQESQNTNSSGGGLGGMLARKMMKKDTEAKQRATIFTINTEVLEVATTVQSTDIDIPAGFKQKQ